MKSGGALSVHAQASSCEPPLGGICSYTPAIEGEVAAAGAVAGCGYVAGGCESGQGASLSLPVLAQPELLCPTGAADVTVSVSTVLPPGQYGAIQVASGQTLSLQAGQYSVASLLVEAGATIAVPPTGTVNLNACGQVSLGEGARISGANSGSDALRFQIFSAGTQVTEASGVRNQNAIYVGKGAELFATLSAPDGGILIDSWSTVFGFAHGSRVILAEGVVLDSTGVTGIGCSHSPQFGVCLAEEIEAGAESVQGRGLCVENGESHVDPACSGIDLAVDFGCEGSVPVCNHGSTTAPAGAVLSFFPREGQQFAHTSPDLTWRLGTCEVNEAIGAGECVHVSCAPGLTAREATVVVNVDAAIPECSLLDNWSVHDPEQLCPRNPGTGSSEFVERYEARCPADSVPHWGFLTWHAQTPGSSSIEFMGRIAGAESALESAVFLPLGRASLSPEDTQSCSYLSPLAECPVEFLTKLPPSPDHFGFDVNVSTGLKESVSFLELGVELSAMGSEVAVLEDWNITYSCVFDQ